MAASYYYRTDSVMFHPLDSLIAVDNVGDTFLQSAAKVGNVQVLEALEQLLRDSSDTIVSAGHMGLVRTLISDAKPFALALLNGHGAFVEKWLTLTSIAGMPFSDTLYSAISTGIPPEILHRIRKEKDGEDAIHYMPLYILLYAGKFQAVQLLLHHTQRLQLKVSTQDEKHNRTCLHWAVLHQQKDIIEALFHYNSHLEWKQAMKLNPSLQDHYGKTALQIAFESGNPDLSDALLQNPSFFKVYEDKLYKKRENKMQIMQWNLTVATVICGISFTALLQVLDVLAAMNEIRLEVFMIFVIIAFFTSVIAICYGILQLICMQHGTIPTKACIHNSTILVIVSFMALSIAFAVACTTISDSIKVGIPILILKALSFGGLACLTFIMLVTLRYLQTKGTISGTADIHELRRQSSTTSFYTC